MGKRIAIFGKYMSPAGLHHRLFVERALEYCAPGETTPFFDEVIVYPCGRRTDDPNKTRMAHVHRAAMVDLTFRDIPRCRIMLDDLEKEEFTRTTALDAEFRAAGHDVWHIVDSTMTHGGAWSPEIQRWEDGERLWEEAQFVIMIRGPMHDQKLPPKHITIDVREQLSPYQYAANIRDLVFRRESLERLVTPEVERYIKRHRLYQDGAPPIRAATRLDLSNPLLVMDAQYASKKAHLIARQLGYPTEGVKHPSCIIALGGDSTMMHAVRKHWREHAPFFGINTGRVGFHLNEAEVAELPARLSEEMESYHLPMLSVSYEDGNGVWRQAVAYQDSYLKPGHDEAMVNLSMTINGKVQYENLRGDAAIVALPVGSSGYAKSAGAMTCPVHLELLIFAIASFNDASVPSRYRPLGLPFDSVIEFRNLNAQRWHPRGRIDGVDLGEVKTMRIRVSQTAATEVVYFYGHDPTSKLLA